MQASHDVNKLLNFFYASYTFTFIGLALLDGFVYAVGGWEGTSRLDSVERYNPETNTWSSIPNLRMAVTSPAVITNEGKIYETFN